MREIKELLQFCNSHAHEQLVLCTLVRKSGSSYRTVGAQKIVSLGGDSCGFLSGGCLESEIEKTARESHTSLPLESTFSTATEEDRLLGYQTGCQGEITVRFEKCDPVIFRKNIEDLQKSLNLKIQLIGCGADIYPLLDLVLDLGWDVRIFDYRKSLAEGFSYRGLRAQHVKVEDIASSLEEGPLSAVVLMTHNYEADLFIVKPMLAKKFGYVGCLGPALRWQRMQKDLLKFHDTSVPDSWRQKVCAPAGLFPRGHDPAEIALSIVAQIQERLIEVPSRSTHWTLILAAGASRRFGGAKFLAEYQGQNFLERALVQPQGQFLVVTGAWHREMQPWLQMENHILNPDWDMGMGKSISVGLRAILEKDPNVHYVTVMTIDQPLQDRSHLQELEKLSRITDKVVLTSTSEVLGPPATIPQKFFSRVLELQGEKGVRSVLREGEWMSLSHKAAGLDFDTPKDLENLISPL